MPSSLRVLHVISSTSLLRGGPSVSMRNMLTALRQRGITADVATTDDDGDTARLDVPTDRFVAIDGQRVRYFPRQTRKYCVSIPMLWWLARHVHDYDIVHTHGLFSFAPLAAARCARLARVPYVMRPAGVLDTWGMKNKSRLVKAASVRLAEAPLLRRAAAVHFTSPLEQERAAQLSLPMRPIVLPTGVQLETPADEPPDPVEQIDPGRDTVVLYLARIHPIKCLDMLLRAFAALECAHTRLHLVVAGDGEPALVASLKRLADGLGIAHRVHWLGFVAGSRKRWLLRHASLFVLPSASENFGIAVVEAMSAGLPVIVTRGCGLADFVRRQRTGIVTDGTEAGLRAALTELLDDAERRLAMGRAGFDAVRKELSLDAFGARLERLYLSIITGGGALLSPVLEAHEP